MEKVPEKILLVDDDRNLLDSFKRQLRKRLTLQTATSAADGLQAITYAGPFAVVISDMQMPNMDGIEFLTRVRISSPNTVRIMLTGNANLDMAISAVNDGNIFRFLNKPVDSGVLYESIIDGIQQYRLVTAERVLLNKTLKGVVDLLSDMLSLVNPIAFSQASRSKRLVRSIVRHLDLADGWSYELASMLSQLGYATLPIELLDKIRSGQKLTNSENELLKNHPKIGSRLLKHIPRLETVAAMIERQNKSVEQLNFTPPLTAEDKASLGGQILRVVIAYDEQIDRGVSDDTAIETLKDQPEAYDPALVRALALGESGNQQIELLSLPVEKLEAGMILDQPIRSRAGAPLVTKGQEINAPIKMRLLVARETGVISGTFKVIRITEK